MTLDQRLTQAARHLGDAVVVPEVDLAAVRSQARANRRRTVSLAVAGVAVAAVAIGTAVQVGDERSAPVSPVNTPSPTSAATDPPTTTSTPKTVSAPELQRWIDGLPVGGPPTTPYFHDRVLHVGGAEIAMPYADVEIDAAGGTVIVGRVNWQDPEDAEWWLVRGDRLEFLTEAAYPQLSPDGTIAYWESEPTATTTRYTAWDTETNEELSSREVNGQDLCCGQKRIMILGMDREGFAYLLDERQSSPVSRWDVRADTVEPTDLTFDPNADYDEQFEVFDTLSDAYVSPDGTRTAFTGSIPADSDQDCCATTLRVRPVGPEESVEAGDVVTLELPEGIPSMRLWDGYSDRGTWGVWWENDEDLLVDAEAGSRSYLVRCSTTDGACELVFELGRNSSRDILYMADWESDWGFARNPVD